MQHFIRNLTINFLLFFATIGSAEQMNCQNFGSIEFFTPSETSVLKECLANVEEQELTKIHSNGNTAIMNAVIADVNAVMLANLLSKYDEDSLIELFQHRNFKELSVVHMASVTQNAPSQLVTLKNFGADFNILRDKKEGYIYDRGVSALHYAISENAPSENILALLALGVDPLRQDKRGNQAINHALSHNADFEVLNILLTFTKKYYKNDRGNSALHFAVQKIDDVQKLNLVFNSIDDGYYDELTSADESILHLSAGSATSKDVFDVVLKNSTSFACKEDSKGARAIDYARLNPNINSSPQVLTLQNMCN
jgi:hypothetical protein